ncbi:hypothetical protein ES707_13995 [subsurface metagenome]
MGDIVLVEGNNELNVQLAPLAPVLANLYGTVTDADTGQGIAGVRVTTTGAITESDSNGDYTILDLTPGSYTVQFAKDGFETKEVNVSAHEGNNELNVQLVPIAPVGVEITGISISKTSLVEEDPFTISITFSNPHDYDVWVSPKFAFGEAVLCGWDYVWDRNYDYTAKQSSVDLGLVQHMGSGMTNYLYAPDGAALTSGGRAFLKIPAKGQATTSRLWYISYYARSKYFSGTWVGWIEIYPPIDLNVSVSVESAFNLIYHPEGIGIIRYGLPWAIGNTRHYELVNYVYVPFTGVAPYMVNISSNKPDLPPFYIYV